MCNPFSLVGMRPTLIGVAIPLVTLILSHNDSFHLSYKHMQVNIVLSYCCSIIVYVVLYTPNASSYFLFTTLFSWLLPIQYTDERKNKNSKSSSVNKHQLFG